MTLLWDADPAASDRYDFAVGKVTRVDTQAAMVRALEEAPDEQLVLIGPDVDMEKYLRHAAGLPDMPEDAMPQARRYARMEEAARFAETQTRYLAARSQLAQALANEEMLASGQSTPEMAMQQQQVAQGAQQQQTAAAGEQRAEEAHVQQMSQPQQQAGGGSRTGSKPGKELWQPAGPRAGRPPAPARPAARRSPLSRCGPTGAWSRWSAAATIRTARSTA